MTSQVPPLDAHNARLMANVHPPDWVNPTPAPRYNLVVLGAGTAGLVSAAGAAGLGAKTALIEREWMGGDCLNVGGLRTLAQTIHPYPTQAEALKKIGDSYNRARLTSRIRWLSRRWLRWTR